MTDRETNTKRHIAVTALEVLKKHGTEGLTMRKVASAAGVSLSNLQYHYGSREDLLAGLTDYHLEECRDALQRGVEEQKGDPLRALIRASLTDTKVLQVASVFRHLFALSENNRAVRSRLHTYYAQSCAEAIDQLHAGGSARTHARAREVVAVITTCIEGYYLVGDATQVAPEKMAALLHRTARAMLS